MPQGVPRGPVKALLVEDDVSLAATLADLLGVYTGHVAVAHSIAQAVPLIRGAPPDLVLTDFALPDGTAFELLEELNRLQPLPVIVSMSGEADSTQGFQLAQLGVRAFIPKPCSLAQVRATIEQVLARAPNLTPVVRATVGHVPLEELELGVRQTLVQEALAKSGGSIKSAAKLLGISRQRLQYIIRTTRDL